MKMETEEYMKLVTCMNVRDQAKWKQLREIPQNSFLHMITWWRFKCSNPPLIPQILVKPLYKLLGIFVDLMILLSVIIHRERRVRDPKLSHQRAIPEPRQPQYRILVSMIQDIDHLMQHVDFLASAAVETVIILRAVVLTTLPSGMVVRVSRTVAAAELVLAGGDERREDVVLG